MIELFYVYNKTKSPCYDDKGFCSLPSSPASLLKYDLLQLYTVLSHSRGVLCICTCPSLFAQLHLMLQNSGEVTLSPCSFQMELGTSLSMFPWYPALALSLWKYCMVLQLSYQTGSSLKAGNSFHPRILRSQYDACLYAEAPCQNLRIVKQLIDFRYSLRGYGAVLVYWQYDVNPADLC